MAGLNPHPAALDLMAKERRLIERFVEKNPHLAFERLIANASCWLCRATWEEIAYAWARHDLGEDADDLV